MQPFTCKVVCGKCGAVYWRRTWTRNGRKVRGWQCGKRYQKKGEVGYRNGIMESRESFLPAWEKQRAKGNALEKWRAGQMMELTQQPPLDTVCPEIVNMILGSVEAHDGGLLHFYFLDGMGLEIETDE